MNELKLLAAAQAGDENAFRDLLAPYRTELHAHCYRMLGSVHDGEDALQDALLRAWRALPRFEGRSSLRTWLYAIVTNACLKTIEKYPKRVLPVDYGPATDPHDLPGDRLVEVPWIEPYPDEGLRYEQRESVELAFIAAFQRLPPRQRAVLILRDVLGFSGHEVAEALDTTIASVHSALQRAHKTVDGLLPEQTQQTTLRSLDDDQLRAIVRSFVAAWERADVDDVVAMLTDEAIMSMPPIPGWYRGREAIAAFLGRGPLSGENRWRLVPARANGQLAFGHYGWDGSAFGGHGLTLVTLSGARISEITAFLDPDVLPAFGLPATQPGA